MRTKHRRAQMQQKTRHNCLSFRAQPCLKVETHAAPNPQNMIARANAERSEALIAFMFRSFGARL
jgi:hypothetical protein